MRSMQHAGRRCAVLRRTSAACEMQVRGERPVHAPSMGHGAAVPHSTKHTQHQCSKTLTVHPRPLQPRQLPLDAACTPGCSSCSAEPLMPLKPAAQTLAPPETM